MEFYKMIEKQMNNKTFVLKVLDTNKNKIILVKVNANNIEEAKKVAILQYDNITFID